MVGSHWAFSAAGGFPLPPRAAPLPSLRAFAAARSVAAAAPEQLVGPTTSVEDAIGAACAALGRAPGPAEAQLAETLRSNWFASAADLGAMSDSQATVLGLPLRLKAWIDEELAAAADDAAALSEASDGEGEGALELAAAAVELLSGEEPAPEAAPAEQGWEALPLELRVCPPPKRFGHSYESRPRVVERGRATKYALSPGELTPALAEEVAALRRFGTVRFFGAQEDPIAEVTAAKYADHLRGALGWLHRVRDVPLTDLSLRSVVPSSARAAVAVTFDYCQWLATERGVSPRTELLVLRSVLHAAKFLYHDESDAAACAGLKPYSDLEVVRELRGLISAANKKAKVAPRVADEAAKWLDWPQYLNLVRELRRECALLREKPQHWRRRLAGSAAESTLEERPRKEVAWSLQRYLIFAILASVPDRQRTLRELAMGKTLVKDGEGRWVIKHGSGDYKTGKVYGERPPLVLNAEFYPELEAFIATWRAELAPEHDFLFTQANGRPFTDKQFSKFFMVAAYRITGKRLTPHMVRDSIVTHLRKGHASERQLEALALYMGHSLEMQRGSYDRRTKGEKVAPAVLLLEELNKRAA